MYPVVFAVVVIRIGFLTNSIPNVKSALDRPGLVIGFRVVIVTFQSNVL